MGRTTPARYVKESFPTFDSGRRKGQGLTASDRRKIVTALYRMHAQAKTLAWRARFSDSDIDQHIWSIAKEIERVIVKVRG